MFDQQKIEPKQGMVVDFGTMKGRIQSTTGGRVRVDFNNPLAGKTLKYDLEVVEKIESAEDKIRAIGQFFGADDLAGTVNDDVLLETKYRLPAESKERIVLLVMKFVCPDKKNVKFIEVFERPTSL